MKAFRDREFARLRDFESGAVFADMEFVRFRFMGCSVSDGLDHAKRSTVRNMRFIGCEEGAYTIGTAILEGVFVDDLKTHGRFDVWGAVFKHVTVRGRVGNLKISDYIPGVAGSAESAHKLNLRFQAANAEYYNNVDWALDISQAEFEECEIKGVPGQLIHRDPDTQVLIRRSKVLELEGELSRLDLSKTHWMTSLKSILTDRHHVDRVLVAPKRSKKFKDLLEGLNLLRRAGIAEPD